MKIVCTHENLKKGLNITSRISNGSTTLPVLNNVLLKTDQGGLKISATNLEMGVNTWVRCKVEDEGSISVPAKTFTDLINNLPPDNITLEANDGHLFIHSNGYKTKIKGLSADEFPLIPQISEENGVTVSAGDLKDSIIQVAFAAAYSETQPEISGVLFSFEDSKLKLVATDRYRLAEKTMDINAAANRNIIIPNRAIQELAKVLASAGSEQVSIYVSQNQAMFKAGETELTSRLIDGQYPDYKQIIPQEFNTEVQISTDDLASAMRTTGIFTQTGNNVNLEYAAPDSLTVSAASGDIGESSVNVESKVSGSSGKIIFNHRYILDCLSAIGTKNVTFHIINESSPAVLKSADLPGYVYLVMPIKI
ncbi:DNA polymerase III subunit beta [Patescibacteria group bacterium]|nr:DNA polymerase III subunit beta [Patescibacteria group bacterium]